MFLGLVLEALLAAARSRFGSEAPPGLHSLPNRSTSPLACGLGHGSALKPAGASFTAEPQRFALPGTNRCWRTGRCGSGISKSKSTRFGVLLLLEAPPGIEPGVRVLQTRALPLGYGAIWSGKRGSNPPPQPWQGCALPDELHPQMVPPVGIEPTTRGFSVPCSTD